MALFTGASLVGGFAESPALLIAMRAVQGIGAALVTPAALSIITTSFEDGLARNRALGIWGAVGASALAAGLILGAIITDTVGWRWILWVNVPIGVLALLLTPSVLPRSSRDAGEPLDLPGATVAVAGLVALVFGVGRAEESGLGSVLTLGLIVGGVALLGAFLLVERVVRSPLAPPALLADRSVTSANLVSLAANGAFAGAFVLVSLYLQLVLDLGALATGLALVPMALSVVVGAGGLSARLVRRLGARTVIAGGHDDDHARPGGARDRARRHAVLDARPAGQHRRRARLRHRVPGLDHRWRRAGAGRAPRRRLGPARDHAGGRGSGRLRRDGRHLHGRRRRHRDARRLRRRLSVGDLRRGR